MLVPGEVTLKPAPFEYHRCESIEHAVALLHDLGDDASVLAGGQSLIALMNLRLVVPTALVDVGRLGELDYVACSPEAVSVGAMTRARAVERSADVSATLPVLADAIGEIGHPQIRSRTTVGGNIAHADPASELPAVLVGLDGDVELRSGDGTRVVPASELFEGMWTTTRRPTELLTRVRFPSAPQLRKTFVEFARRPGDFALAGVFAGFEVDDAGRVADVRLAVCGVDSTPLRLSEIEDTYSGELASGELAEAIGASVRSAVDPADSPDCPAQYRQNLCGVLAARAIQTLLEQRR